MLLLYNSKYHAYRNLYLLSNNDNKTKIIKFVEPHNADMYINTIRSSHWKYVQKHTHFCKYYICIASSSDSLMALAIILFLKCVCFCPHFQCEICIHKH